MKKKKDLINLNSKIFKETSVEELEERLELSGGWLCDCPGYGGCPCYTGDSMCYPVNEASCYY